ncbi:two-component system response regulator [Burkholderia ubonensis]|uniref:response regulator transcription factor n=1 Tax=Burkholderia ubonensis TaxID=101571 RepID=UPI0007536283|nr:response regulator transcription factor [Burkholderia ubonensis]KVP81060.1 two-component system response regulator [Burkholderia ubonensis]
MNTTKSPAVLIVEDDEPMRRLLCNYLSGHGMAVDGVGTVAAAIELAERREYEMALLDLSLPDGDGINVLLRWRESQRFPIICMTGRHEVADRIMGLEFGADDYVVKPYSLREVLARMRALWRRAESPTTPVRRGKHPCAYHFDGWTLNLNTRRLSTRDAREVSLTGGEFNILVFFLGSPSRVVTRAQLIEGTRAFDDVFDRAVDVKIWRLRKKIEKNPKQPELILTERGVGYYFAAKNVETIWE